MLLQSHAGEIHLLPALPRAWADGAFAGLRARGGLEIDLVWTAGRATAATLRPTADGVPRLRPPAGQQIASVKADGTDVKFATRDLAAEITLQAGKV